MSIAMVVTRGFGSFGSIADVVRAGYGGTSAAVVYDTHDGGDERKKWEEYKEAREALRTQITESFEIVTGEVRIPEPIDLVRIEKQAKLEPKAERKVVFRTVSQIRAWEAQLREVERIMEAMEEDDIVSILRLM